MKRAAGKRAEPYVPPVDKIELSSVHSGRKMVLTIVFLVIAAASFVYGFMQLLKPDEGWQTIQASSGGEISCGDDFVLLYDLGSSDVSVSEEKKGLTAVYTDAAVLAYRLFESSSIFDGVHNVAYINQHPNEIIEVDPALYGALEQVRRSGNRSLYLGPVYEVYNGLFSCENDTQAADFDPRQDDSLREYFARCAEFGRDPASVDMELLGEGQVRLHVSEEYLAFAHEQQIGAFVDFNWMKNAFIIDLLADALAENGYVNGALSSYDGFMRNLYGGEEAFGLNIYDRGDPAGSMTYTGPMSIVYLRGYPINSLDAQHFYVLEDGQVRSSYVDPADGLCRTAWDDLLAYTGTGGCAQTLLALAPVYVADQPEPAALAALADGGVFSLYCADKTIRHNDPALSVTAEEGYSVVLDEN